MKRSKVQIKQQEKAAPYLFPITIFDSRDNGILFRKSSFLLIEIFSEIEFQNYLVLTNLMLITSSL